MAPQTSLLVAGGNLEAGSEPPGWQQLPRVGRCLQEGQLEPGPHRVSDIFRGQASLQFVPLFFWVFSMFGLFINGVDCVLPAWLVTRILAAGGPVQSQAEGQSCQLCAPRSLPLMALALLWVEWAWHVLTPVRLLIYLCIPIHNSIITHLKQCNNYFTSWVVKINRAHCIFIL